jgi:hypothetical protein
VRGENRGSWADCQGTVWKRGSLTHSTQSCLNAPRTHVDVRFSAVLIGDAWAMTEFGFGDPLEGESTSRRGGGRTGWYPFRMKRHKPLPEGNARLDAVTVWVEHEYIGTASSEMKAKPHPVTGPRTCRFWSVTHTGCEGPTVKEIATVLTETPGAAFHQKPRLHVVSYSSKCPSKSASVNRTRSFAKMSLAMRVG